MQEHQLKQGINGQDFWLTSNQRFKFACISSKGSARNEAEQLCSTSFLHIIITKVDSRFTWVHSTLWWGGGKTSFFTEKQWRQTWREHTQALFVYMKRAHTGSLCVCLPTTHIAEWKLASGVAEGILQLTQSGIAFKSTKSPFSSFSSLKLTESC